jgi:hypothetical protein
MIERLEHPLGEDELQRIIDAPSIVGEIREGETPEEAIARLGAAAAAGYEIAPNENPTEPIWSEGAVTQAEAREDAGFPDQLPEDAVEITPELALQWKIESELRAKIAMNVSAIGLQGEGEGLAASIRTRNFIAENIVTGALG